MTCYQMKIAEFIDYLLGDKPLPDNWEDLYAEYIGLRENKSSLYIIGLLKEIANLKSKFFLIQECVQMLNVCFQARLPNTSADRLKTMLKDWGFRAEYNMENSSTFSRDVKAVLSRSKSLKTQWAAKEKELQQYEEKHKGKSRQRKDFHVWVVTLSKHMGYRVDLNQTTVAEWCQMINDYERYCEVANAEHYNKLKGKKQK